MCWGWVGFHRDNITYPKSLDAMRKKEIKAVALSNNTGESESESRSEMIVRARAEVVSSVE